jgi:hypothetical protein
MMDFGFSHCYHLHLSLFPWEDLSFTGRLDKAYGLMKRAGAVSFRPHVHWNRVEPLIKPPFPGVADITSAMVDRYVEGGAGIFWEETDIMINKMIEHGLDPFLCLGAGYLHQMPLVSAGRHIVRFDHYSIPAEAYLGRLSLHARAVVRRYKDRCRRWQLENELNEAAGTFVLLRWRLGIRWLFPSFLNMVMAVLHDAVKKEDPRALTSHNMSMSFKIIPHLYSWYKDILSWNKYMDIIGFDPFPNYIKGEPIKIGITLQKIAGKLRALGLNKPLYVLEDGYPAMPFARGFSEENQKLYYGELLDAAERIGLEGVFAYCFSSQEGSPGNEWHKRMKIQDIEDWWGLFRADGTPRPAYDFLLERCGKRNV